MSLHDLVRLILFNKKTSLILIFILLFIPTVPSFEAPSQSSIGQLSIVSLTTFKANATDVEEHLFSAEYNSNTLFYGLNVSISLNVYQNTSYYGFFSESCGPFRIQLLKNVNWQLANFVYNCPMISGPTLLEPGIYNLTFNNIIIQSTTNHTNPLFPATLGLEIVVNLNQNIISSVPYYFTLSDPFYFSLSDPFYFTILVILIFIVLVTVFKVIKHKKYKEK